MVDRSNKHFAVTVEFPEELRGLIPSGGSDIGYRLRVLWLVELVRERLLGAQHAARIAGMGLMDFYVELGKHGVPALDLDVDEFDEDMATLEELVKAS